MIITTYVHHLIVVAVHQSYYALSLLLLIGNVSFDEIPMMKEVDFLYILLEPMCDLDKIHITRQECYQCLYNNNIIIHSNNIIFSKLTMNLFKLH